MFLVLLLCPDVPGQEKYKLFTDSAEDPARVRRSYNTRTIRSGFRCYRDVKGYGLSYSKNPKWSIGLVSCLWVCLCKERTIKGGKESVRNLPICPSVKTSRPFLVTTSYTVFQSEGKIGNNSSFLVKLLRQRPLIFQWRTGENSSPGDGEPCRSLS